MWDTTVRPWQQSRGVQAAWQGRGAAAELDEQRTEPEQAEEAAVEGGGSTCGGADDTGQGVGCLCREMEGGEGGVWPVEASCVLVEGEERWVLDEPPAELNEQAYMWQWEQGVDCDDTWRQEWPVLRLEAWAGEEQLGIVDWMGEPWEQKGAEEDFAEGAEQQLLGEAPRSMRRDQQKWQSRLVTGRGGGGSGECSMCTQMEVRMERAHRQAGCMRMHLGPSLFNIQK